MSKKQSFDFAEAARLQTTLNSKVDEIDATLNNIKQTVEGVREWWSGGSEVAFIENFESTKGKIRTGLQNWLSEYDKLLKQVVEVKKEGDSRLSGALRKS